MCNCNKKNSNRNSRKQGNYNCNVSRKLRSSSRTTLQTPAGFECLKILPEQASASLSVRLFILHQDLAAQLKNKDNYKDIIGAPIGNYK